MSEEEKQRFCAEQSAAAFEEENLRLSEHGESRREFLGKVSVTGLSVLAAQLLLEQDALAAGQTSESAAFVSSAPENAVDVRLKINGAEQSLNLDSRVSLLDALREKLDLTGTKKGCDHGQCGACTVIMNGRRVLSCLMLAAMCDGSEVTTIEGIAKGEELHAVQAAFIKYDAFQCGYCTPGQICSAVALLNEAKNGEASYVTQNLRTNARSIQLSDDEIRERMSGNLCRCGAYPHIVDAVREVHTGKETAQNRAFVGGEAANETV